MISEVKSCDLFTNALFYINGFSNPYRLDRTVHGSGIFIYIQDKHYKSSVKRHLPNTPKDPDKLLKRQNMRIS